MNPSTTPRSNRRRLVAVGVIATTLIASGAGAALAGPRSAVGQAVGSALGLVGVDWSEMPDGYDKQQYEAFWGAGYSSTDVASLQALWGTDLAETKVRAGQMLLDGESVPVEPSGASEAEAEARYNAFWDAGYTIEDAEALSALWDTDLIETKARAGQVLVDGQTLPIAPGSTTATS